MNQLEISPAVSQATTAAARWFDHHRDGYTADDEDLFDALLRLIETPPHLDALSEELGRRMLPEPRAKDRAPYPKEYGSNIPDTPRPAGLP